MPVMENISLLFSSCHLELLISENSFLKLSILDDQGLDIDLIQHYYETK